MATVDYDLSEWTRFKRQMESLNRNVPDVMHRAGQEAGAYFDHVVHDELPPPVRVRKQAPYWTDKQKAWWWGTMHEKALGRSQALPGWKAVYRKVNGRKTLVISGHYKRTKTLVNSLTYEVRSSANETTVVYGTNRAYATWVIDEYNLASYHRGNWKSLQDFARQETDNVRRVFAKTAFDEIDRYFGVR